VLATAPQFCGLKIASYWDLRVEHTATGHLTFNARTGKHDDLVLALAIAVWRAHGGGMPNYGLYGADAPAGSGFGGERAALLSRR
jgi:hypothetical protein